VLSQYDDPAHATELFQDGVSGGLLLKERIAVPGQLADAVRQVAAAARSSTRASWRRCWPRASARAAARCTT